MAITFSKLFAPVQLPASNGTVFTMSATPTTIILKNGRVRLTNTTAGAVAVTLYAVPSGGSAGVGNMFLNAVSVAGNNYLDTDIPTLAAGDSLQGFAGAATSVTIHEIGGVLSS